MEDESRTNVIDKTVTSIWRGGYTDNAELRRELLAQVQNRNPWT